MTTGDPGTDAQVTNSGTPQNAVFDFTIPKGDTGSAPPVSLLSAYSTSAQPGTSGSAMLFDRNGLSYGSDISQFVTPNVEKAVKEKFGAQYAAQP